MAWPTSDERAETDEGHEERSRGRGADAGKEVRDAEAAPEEQRDHEPGGAPRPSARGAPTREAHPRRAPAPRWSRCGRPGPGTASPAPRPARSPARSGPAPAGALTGTVTSAAWPGPSGDGSSVRSWRHAVAGASRQHQVTRTAPRPVIRSAWSRSGQVPVPRLTTVTVTSRTSPTPHEVGTSTSAIRPRTGGRRGRAGCGGRAAASRASSATKATTRGPDSREGAAWVSPGAYYRRPAVWRPTGAGGRGCRWERRSRVPRLRKSWVRPIPLC